MSGFSSLGILHSLKLHKSVPTKQGQSWKREQSFRFTQKKKKRRLLVDFWPKLPLLFKSATKASRPKSKEMNNLKLQRTLENAIFPKRLSKSFNLYATNPGFSHMAWTDPPCPSSPCVPWANFQQKSFVPGHEGHCCWWCTRVAYYSDFFGATCLYEL